MDSEADKESKEIVQKNPSFILKREILTENIVSKDVEIPLLSAKIPVLDLALLSNGQEEEHKLLDEACKYRGFFLVINHGIPGQILEELKSAALKFFNLPLKEKIKYKFDPLAGEGHGSPYPVSEYQTADWSDSLMLHLSPIQARSLELCPAELRGVVEAYSAAVISVSERLLGSLSLIMGMERNALLELHKEMLVPMRVNYYPLCCQPDKVMGLSPHSDTSSITILLQDDDANGLQIRHDGGWVPVKPIPNSLVVNIGDVMEIWSNGKYKSIEHKAVTSATKERISLATFVCPQMEVDVEPLEQMLDNPQQGRLYNKVNYGEYLINSLGRRLEGKEYIANNAS